MPLEVGESKVKARDRILLLLKEFAFESVKSDSKLIKALTEAMIRFEDYINLTLFQNLNIREVIVISSECLGVSLDRINRKQENRLCFEAAFIMLLSLCKECAQLTMTEVEFIEAYPTLTPEEVGSTEFKMLFRFRNMLKIAMHVIPAVNNKDHLLDLVTRLVDGHHVKRVTGSGATKATRQRVNMILNEGQLVVPKRPPRRDDPPAVTLANRHRIAGAKRSEVVDAIVYQRVYKKRVRELPNEDVEDDSSLVNGSLIEELVPKTVDPLSMKLSLSLQLPQSIQARKLIDGDQKELPAAAINTAATGGLSLIIPWESNDGGTIDFDAAIGVTPGGSASSSLLSPFRVDRQSSSLLPTSPGAAGGRAGPRLASGNNPFNLEPAVDIFTSTKSTTDEISILSPSATATATTASSLLDLAKPISTSSLFVPHVGANGSSLNIIPGLVSKSKKTAVKTYPSAPAVTPAPAQEQGLGLGLGLFEMPPLVRTTSDEWYEYPLANTSVGCPIPQLHRFPSAPLH